MAWSGGFGICFQILEPSSIFILLSILGVVLEPSLLLLSSHALSLNAELDPGWQRLKIKNKKDDMEPILRMVFRF